MEGVWIGFPDTGEHMDTTHSDELLLGLDALRAETLNQCMAVDVDCALPQITDILNQYDSAGELVRHAIDFGYVWAEQGQGEPHWMEKWQCVMELEDCHCLDLHWISLKTSIAMNSFHEGLILHSMAWIWPEIWLAVFVDDLLPIPGCIAMIRCGRAIFCHVMLGVGHRVKALVEQRILAKYTQIRNRR